MRALGLESSFWALAPRRIVSHESVWGSRHVDTREMIASAHGPSWLLDRAKFDGMMRESVRASGAEAVEGRLVSLERTGSKWNYTFRTRTGHETGQASFLLDASGRNSIAARKLGAHRLRADRLISVPMVVRSELNTDLDDTTRLEANEDGWFFSCRISASERLISFYTDSDLLPASIDVRKKRIEYLLGQSEHLSDRMEHHSYSALDPQSLVPAHGSLLDPLGGEGWLATGEAAFCHDPLCGDGIIEAMNSARHAARALVAGANGDSNAFVEYKDQGRERFKNYQLTLRSYYALEMRWRNHAFWKRRS